MKEELGIRIRLRLAAAGLRRAGREAVVVRHGESVSPLRPDRVPTSKKIGSKNGATGRSDIEGKVTRVGASEPGGDRVSIKKGREIKLPATEYALLRLSFGILVAFSHIVTSFAKSGARNRKNTANIFAFMSPTCARRLKVILQVQVSSRPSREIGYRFIQ